MAYYHGFTFYCFVKDSYIFHCFIDFLSRVESTLYIHVSHSWEWKQITMLKHSKTGKVLKFPLRKWKEAHSVFLSFVMTMSYQWSHVLIRVLRAFCQMFYRYTCQFSFIQLRLLLVASQSVLLEDIVIGYMADDEQTLALLWVSNNVTCTSSLYCSVTSSLAHLSVLGFLCFCVLNESNL